MLARLTKETEEKYAFARWLALAGVLVTLVLLGWLFVWGSGAVARVIFVLDVVIVATSIMGFRLARRWKEAPDPASVLGRLPESGFSYLSEEGTYWYERIIQLDGHVVKVLVSPLTPQSLPHAMRVCAAPDLLCRAFVEFRKNEIKRQPRRAAEIQSLRISWIAFTYGDETAEVYLDSDTSVEWGCRWNGVGLSIYMNKNEDTEQPGGVCQ